MVFRRADTTTREYVDDASVRERDGGSSSFPEDAMSIGRITGGGTNFQKPVVPQQVQQIQEGGQKVSRDVTKTDVPGHNAAAAFMAQQIEKATGLGQKIDLLA